MTINDKHLEQKHEKGGEQQITGTPITKTEDNAHQQRQEMQNAMKAYRFTKGDNPFTIDMGDGGKVVDKRPMQPGSVATPEWSNVQQNEQVQKPGDFSWYPNKPENSSPDLEGREAAIRPHPADKTYNEQDHQWHDNKTKEVVGPPPSGMYSAAHIGDWFKDEFAYADHVRRQEAREKGEVGSRDLSDMVDKCRPHCEDKTFDKRDNQWHDNKSHKVVEPPDTKLYPPPVGGALAVADQINYYLYQLSHPNG